MPFNNPYMNQGAGVQAAYGVSPQMQSRNPYTLPSPSMYGYQPMNSGSYYNYQNYQPSYGEMAQRQENIPMGYFMGQNREAGSNGQNMFDRANNSAPQNTETSLPPVADNNTQNTGLTQQANDNGQMVQADSGMQSGDKPPIEKSLFEIKQEEDRLKLEQHKKELEERDRIEGIANSSLGLDLGTASIDNTGVVPPNTGPTDEELRARYTDYINSLPGNQGNAPTVLANGEIPMVAMSNASGNGRTSTSTNTQSSINTQGRTPVKMPVGGSSRQSTNSTVNNSMRVRGK